MRMPLANHARAAFGRGRGVLMTGVAAVLVSALVACSSGSGSSSAGSQSLTFDLASPFYTLDVNVSPAAVDARAMRQIFDSLVAESSNHRIVPWLATKWTISNDGLRYDFDLRTDVKFQDGTPFNAAAVCFNFDRIKNPETASLYAGSLIAPVESCTTTGADSFTLKLSRPFGALLSYLAMPFLGIASPTAVRKYGKQFGVHPVGSGPFEFSSYAPNSQLVLTRNPDYNWAPGSAGHQGPAYLERLTFKIVPEDSTRIGSVESGEATAVDTLPGQDTARIKANSGLTFTVIPQSGLADNLFINTRRAPWTDLTMREALRDSMDIGGAVSSLYFGVYGRAWGPLVPSTEDYDPSVVNSWRFDPTKAGQLFDSEGWTMGSDGYRHKNGQTLSVIYLTVVPDRDKRQETATYLQQVMKRSGIKVNIQGEAATGFAPVIERGDYDLADTSFINPTANIMFSIFDSKFMPKPGYQGTNVGRVNDPALDTMLTAAQHTGDTAERSSLYKQIQQRILKNIYSIGVYNPSYTVAMSTKVTGMRYDVESYPVFYDVKVG